MINKHTRKATLDDYRLTHAPITGFTWQDKRNGEHEVYKRDFYSAHELFNFLEDTFGARVANRVKAENAGLLN